MILFNGFSGDSKKIFAVNVISLKWLLVSQLLLLVLISHHCIKNIQQQNNMAIINTSTAL